MSNKKVNLIAIALVISLSASSCAFIQKNIGKIGGTLVGCLIGLGLGNAYDQMQNKKADKKKKDPKTMVSEWFKKRKKSNKGKIVGLAAGCAAGLGVGFYLDTMAEDMEERLKKDGITMEKIKGSDGETKEIYLNMGSDAIEFESDAASFKGDSKARVNRLAEAFKAYTDTQIKITGHSSAAKKTSFNTKLSQDRADAVKSQLIAGGVGSGQVIQSQGMANEKPLPGTSKTDARNRRVDIYITAQ
ncbi:MAG: OmpA family protein [Spirochaetota bacterium]